jgi:hypothetical protein
MVVLSKKIMFAGICMGYRGNSEKEALANFNNNVRKRLKDAGLNSLFFEAVTQDVVHLETGTSSSIPALILKLDGPPEERLKAQPIIDEERAKFAKQRYSHD